MYYPLMKLADMYFRQIGRVRVDHLFVGTNRDNMIDMAGSAKGREGARWEKTIRVRGSRTTKCARSAGSIDRDESD